jgi:hypothetical protein
VDDGFGTRRPRRAGGARPAKISAVHLGDPCLIAVFAAQVRAGRCAPSLASATWTLGSLLHLLLVGEPAPAAGGAACDGGLWAHTSEGARRAVRALVRDAPEERPAPAALAHLAWLEPDVEGAGEAARPAGASPRLLLEAHGRLVGWYDAFLCRDMAGMLQRMVAGKPAVPAAAPRGTP